MGCVFTTSPSPSGATSPCTGEAFYFYQLRAKRVWRRVCSAANQSATSVLCTVFVREVKPFCAEYARPLFVYFRKAASAYEFAQQRIAGNPLVVYVLEVLEEFD